MIKDGWGYVILSDKEDVGPIISLKIFRVLNDIIK